MSKMKFKPGYGEEAVLRFDRAPQARVRVRRMRQNQEEGFFLDNGWERRPTIVAVTVLGSVGVDESGPWGRDAYYLGTGSEVVLHEETDGSWGMLFGIDEFSGWLEPEGEEVRTAEDFI